MEIHMLDRFVQFTAVISSIYRFIQKIEREEMEKYGLKGACAQYLLAMLHHPEGITAAALCEVCDKDKAAVSRILSELESKGLVTRADRGDSTYRAPMILTAEGKAAADYVCRKAALAAEIAGKDLSEESRNAFYLALDSLAKNLRDISLQGLPEEE